MSSLANNRNSFFGGFKPAPNPAAKKDTASLDEALLAEVQQYFDALPNVPIENNPVIVSKGADLFQRLMNDSRTQELVLRFRIDCLIANPNIDASTRRMLENYKNEKSGANSSMFKKPFEVTAKLLADLKTPAFQAVLSTFIGACRQALLPTASIPRPLSIRPR